MTLAEWFEPISFYPATYELWTLDVFLDLSGGEDIDAFSKVEEWVGKGADVKQAANDDELGWIGSYSAGNSVDLLDMLRRDLLDLEINTCWIVNVDRIVVLLNKDRTEGEDDYDDTDS